MIRHENSPIENVYLADFYYYGLIEESYKICEAISLYEKTINSIENLNFKSFNYFNSFCILGRAFFTGENGVIEINYGRAESYFKKAWKFEVDKNERERVKSSLKRIENKKNKD